MLVFTNPCNERMDILTLLPELQFIFSWADCITYENVNITFLSDKAKTENSD